MRATIQESDTDNTPTIKPVYKEVPEYVFYNQEFIEQIQGFNNTGAICWFNSLLQLMLSISPICESLLNTKRNLHNNPFALSFCDLIELHRRPLADQEANHNNQIAHQSARILTLFIAQLKQRQLPPLTNGQECVDEGYLLFLDALNCPEVYNVCRNVYEYTIRCTCGMITSQHRDESYRMQVHMLIPSRTKEEFATWLHHHISEVDSFKCTHCGVTQSLPRVEILKVIREVIVCIFNKFQVKTKAFFPPVLEFPSMGKTLHYKLCGQIDHSGTQHSGHYWAKVQRGQLSYTANDATVSSGNLGPTTETFMIAYVLTDRS